MKKTRKTLVVFVSFLLVQGYNALLFAQASAPDSQLQHSKDSAFQRALSNAEAGDYFSMDEVAARYRKGNGTRIDYNKALYWYKKVAEKGFPEAQYSLGTMYYFGEGVPVDKKKAFNWFYKAANTRKMLAPACYSLAFMYAEGEYVQKDKKKAVEWYLKAARSTRDYPYMAALSQNALGESYYHGDGVTKDIEMAYVWFWFAHKYGNKDAEHNLATLEKTLTSEQLISAREKANKVNKKQFIMRGQPFPEPRNASRMTKPLQIQDCPDFTGTYQSDTNDTRIYLQLQNNQHYRAVLEVSGYSLQVRGTRIVSAEERQNPPYTPVPACALNIERFGQLLPHVKGTLYRLTFDSQDWQKKFNTDFVLKTDDTPDGVMGMNKTSTVLPSKAQEALNKP